MAVVSPFQNRVSIGVPAIDTQHDEIFRRADRLVMAMRERRTDGEIGEMIAFLDQYTRSHFRSEETFMALKGYPGLAEQRQEHAAFLEALRAFRREFDASGITPLLAIRLNQLVGEWLVKHIGACDRSFASFLAGGAAAGRGAAGRRP